MHGAVITLYLLGFLADEIAGGTTRNARPKIIRGQAIDIKYRPFMVRRHFLAASFSCRTLGYDPFARPHLLNLMMFTALFARLPWIFMRRQRIVEDMGHYRSPLTPARSRRYYVRAGSNKTDRGGSVHRVTNIRAYNDTRVSGFSRMPYHDIALFEVSPPFRFSKTVRPIRLPRSTNGIQRDLFVCGWGYADVREEKIAETLMGVYVEHVPFDVCVKVTQQYAMLVRDDRHLCYGTGGKDSCYGDSGGALASERTIYGIVSFGHHCGVVPGVYVKLSHYRKWIKDVTDL